MTYIAPTGRVSSKVAKMLEKLYEARGLRVTQFMCTGRRGFFDDVYSWEAECLESCGLRVFVGCFDTMTKCARYGIGIVSSDEVSALMPAREVHGRQQCQRS